MPPARKPNESEKGQAETGGKEGQILRKSHYLDLRATFVLFLLIF